MKINYDGKIISGEDAFNQLVIDNDILGKNRKDFCTKFIYVK